MRSRNVLAAAVLTMVGTALPGVGTAAQAAPVDQCGNGDFGATYRNDGGAAGSRYGWIILRNLSGETCWTQGYGGLSYVGEGDGSQIGAAARREGGSAKRIVLEPGQRVRSRVRESNAGNYPRSQCQVREVEGFRVYAPDTTESIFVVHPTFGCANDRIRLISQRAYRRP
jgi:hypothetical protein